MELLFCKSHVWQGLLRTARILKLSIKGSKEYSLSRCVWDYEKLYQHLRKYNGDVGAFKVMKEVELRIKRIILGEIPSQKPRYDSFGVWIKTDKYGIPTKLFRLSQLCRRKRRWTNRISLLIASRYRLDEAKQYWKYPKDELSFTPFTFDYAMFNRGLKRLSKQYRLSRLWPRSYNLFHRGHWSITSSPYSQESIHGAPYDAYVILSNPKTISFMELMIVGVSRRIPQFSNNGLDEFDKWINWIRDVSNLSTRDCPKVGFPKKILAKFAWVPDRAGKLRGVTPANYFLQGFLLPFHNYFMSLLRFIPMDGAFDEAKCLSWVSRVTGQGYSCNSYDLPAATTQFPLEISARVVRFFLGKLCAQGWFGLMRTPIYFKGIGITPFLRGAPMGFYCLWPVFSLAHHAIMQMAFERAVKPLPSSSFDKVFTSYTIRGDDNVIGGTEICDEVSLEYEFIWKNINQKPSSSKSVLSRDFGPGVAEFAKRIYINGQSLFLTTYAEFRSAMEIDPLVFLDIMPRLIRYHEDRQSMQQRMLSASHAALSVLGPKKFALACKRLDTALYITTISGRAPSDWNNVYPMPILPVDKQELLINTVNQEFKRRVCIQAASAYYSIRHEKPVGKLSILNQDNTELINYSDYPQAFKQVIPEFRSSAGLDVLPLGHYIEDLMKDVENLGDIISTTYESYKVSKVVRRLLEFNGLSESLRIRDRKATVYGYSSKLAGFTRRWINDILQHPEWVKTLDFKDLDLDWEPDDEGFSYGDNEVDEGLYDHLAKPSFTDLVVIGKAIKPPDDS